MDLLADREAESVKRWLTAHPEIEIVSRDRGGVYIDGATWGAPQATQVADRWHILSNLGDAMEEFLIRARLRLPEPAVEVPASQETRNLPLSSFLPPLPVNASRRHAYYANGGSISGCTNCTQLE